MDFNQHIHIKFDLPKDQANLLNKFAIENRDKLRSLGILAVHLNDHVKNQSSADQTTTPTAEFLRQQQQQNNQNHRKTQNNTIQKRPRTVRTHSISKQLSVSTTPRPVDPIDDTNVPPLPPPQQPNNCFADHHNNHYQQYKMPSPLLINLLNKETNTIDINKNMSLMSDDYKRIHNLREILANVKNQHTDSENSSNLIKRKLFALSISMVGLWQNIFEN
jgi:hypothetical protein